MSQVGKSPLMRLLGVSGIVWGTALLTAGPSLWRYLDGRDPTEIDQIAIRLLGGRHLATGATQLFFPTHLQRLEITVDLIHAVSMVALAAVDPPRRRPALVTGGVALASAVGEIAIRSRSPKSSL